ncbi:FKBP-type peptidyl-prolyl cis-trans isomerase [Pseudomonas viridiflava]|nr:FKBP-type peptidyl-prolyl cis-trans isomerase [Pseudomonas viridiflava]
MGMKVGGRRTLFVPAHLAYGDRKMGAHIQPGSDLSFEIELLEVLTRDD